MTARDELQQWIEDADRITGKVSGRMMDIDLARRVLAEMDEARSESAEPRLVYEWLVAELAYEYDALIRRQGDLLTKTANVLRGAPPPLTTWSHHDVAERAAAMAADRDAALATIAQVREYLSTCGLKGDPTDPSFVAPSLTDLARILNQEQQS